MDKGLHEKALRKALSTYWADMFPNDVNEEDWVRLEDMHSAIAAYLKMAGLTVVPVEATEEMREAGQRWSALPGQTWDDMLAAFPSPFDEVK